MKGILFYILSASTWTLRIFEILIYLVELVYYSPCRITSLRCWSDSGVSWLSNTYAQRVPTCLISYSIPSADAALCLAVHIGQLAVSNGGDWGPHLVVTPRLLLPTWRTRLAAVCPGLRVHCVLASARGGTGRRLKAAATQGAFHVCLTTYSALRSRPSRFEGIQWHLVILDQVSPVVRTLFLPSFWKCKWVRMLINVR